VRFQILGPGVTTLIVGTGYPGDVVLLGDGDTEQSSAAFTAGVYVPEPATTLFLGLGLAGLTVTQRPSRSRS
jgi:hypothetical protein